MDISKVCIDHMTERNGINRPEMKWEVMDVRSLTYENEQFDMIIDKGTLDAMLCSDDAFTNVAKMLKEC